MRTISSKLWILLLLLAACRDTGDDDTIDIGGPDAGGMPSRPDAGAPPDPSGCDDADPAYCVGGGDISACYNGEWQQFDCTEACDANGYPGPGACDIDPSDGLSYCFCGGDQPPPPCTDGQMACNGDDLDYCSGGDWTTYDCQALCIDAGYAGTTGCDYDQGSGHDTCYCSNDQPPPNCTDGDLACNGSWAVDYCSGGSWQTYDCEQLCLDAGYPGGTTGCGYSGTSGDDTCFCDSGGGGDPDPSCTSDSCSGCDYYCDEFGCLTCCYWCSSGGDTCEQHCDF
jgi:hypothetical protein